MSGLREVIDEAVGTSPTDHIVTVVAADQLIDHIYAAIVAASGGPDHLMHVTEELEWTIHHPIEERFAGTLFNCPVSGKFVTGSISPGTFTVVLPEEGGMLLVPALVCQDCGRAKVMSDGEYHPIQVVTGVRLGWYSGSDGELCPECLGKLMRRANG